MSFGSLNEPAPAIVSGAVKTDPVHGIAVPDRPYQESGGRPVGKNASLKSEKAGGFGEMSETQSHQVRLTIPVRLCLGHTVEFLEEISLRNLRRPLQVDVEHNLFVIYFLIAQCPKVG